jgi:NADPH:quinone reductase
VVAYCGQNGAREKIALAASTIVKSPDNLDFDRAAGIIITYGTALHALEDRARPKPGETLAVLGAVGGAGVAAGDLGKLMGLKVSAFASSHEKLEFAKQHMPGADAELRQRRSQGRLEAADWRQGVDIIFDPVGGCYAEAALRAIAWEGHFLDRFLPPATFQRCRSTSRC